MKTRIISGVIMAAVVIAVLAVQLEFPVVLIIAMALLSAATVTECLYSTGLCKVKPLVLCGALGSMAALFAVTGFIRVSPALVYTVFVGLIFLATLKYHAEITAGALSAVLVFPILLSYSMGKICLLTQVQHTGMFYIWLMLCWSAIADIGAYFVGVLFGKHKMTPVISPKKTWEGLIGGLVFGVLAALVLSLLYQKVFDYQVFLPLILGTSPVFVLLGVLGDLSASMIKRQCGIKDFGNLIPGHGGILDRLDSILMIAPFLALFLSYFSLIK